MKILLQNRYDALTKKGGDTYQMLLTKKYLVEQGVEVNMTTDLCPNLAGYDLVHLFNITRVHETYIQFINAKKQNKKVVLSPIYHSQYDINNYERRNLRGVPAILATCIKDVNKRQLLKTMFYSYPYPKIWYAAFKQWQIGYTKQQQYVVRNADFLLPNSVLEMNAIKKELFAGDILAVNYEIVYNGIEVKGKEDSPRILDWLGNNQLKDYVICSGRIEPRKNQLKILEALKNSGQKIVLAGAVNNLHRAYAKMVRRQLNLSKNSYYLGEVDHDEMMTLNRYAKVGVLASWFETTGLAGLEAGLTGANVVITEQGYTREYYGDSAWYCDPQSTTSIREAVLAAAVAERGAKHLETRIEQLGLNWREAAKRTRDVYKKVLERK